MNIGVSRVILTGKKGELTSSVKIAYVFFGGVNRKATQTCLSDLKVQNLLVTFCFEKLTNERSVLCSDNTIAHPPEIFQCCGFQSFLTCEPFSPFPNLIFLLSYTVC